MSSSNDNPSLVERLARFAVSLMTNLILLPGHIEEFGRLVLRAAAAGFGAFIFVVLAYIAFVRVTGVLVPYALVVAIVWGAAVFCLYFATAFHSQYLRDKEE